MAASILRWLIIYIDPPTTIGCLLVAQGDVREERGHTTSAHLFAHQGFFFPTPHLPSRQRLNLNDKGEEQNEKM